MRNNAISAWNRSLELPFLSGPADEAAGANSTKITPDYRFPLSLSLPLKADKPPQGGRELAHSPPLEVEDAPQAERGLRGGERSCSKPHLNCSHLTGYAVVLRISSILALAASKRLRRCSSHSRCSPAEAFKRFRFARTAAGAGPPRCFLRSMLDCGEQSWR